VNVSGIEVSDICSLELLLSGKSISIGGSEGLLFGLLGNTLLERVLLGSWRADNQMNLSTLPKKRRIHFESVDVWIISIEALDSLLLNESISIGNEDALCVSF
jgi:hypothetical protein